MKCPRCWAEKAYIHPIKGWKGTLFACLFLTHLKCWHCYHKFVVPWFFTLGKQVEPPARTPSTSRADDPLIVPFRQPDLASHADQEEHQRRAGAA